MQCNQVREQHVADQHTQDRSLHTSEVAVQSCSGLLREHEGEVAGSDVVEIPDEEAQQEGDNQAQAVAEHKVQVRRTCNNLHVEPIAQTAASNFTHVVLRLDHVKLLGKFHHHVGNSRHFAYEEALCPDVPSEANTVRQSLADFPPCLGKLLNQLVHIADPLLHGLLLSLVDATVCSAQRRIHQQLSHGTDKICHNRPDWNHCLLVALRKLFSLGAHLQHSKPPVHLLQQEHVAAQQRPRLTPASQVEAFPPSGVRGDLHPGGQVPLGLQVRVPHVNVQMRLRSAIVLGQEQEQLGGLLRGRRREPPRVPEGGLRPGQQRGEEGEEGADDL
mmetsp:Transcript_100348/g.288275  ORF Transcript_100348/g.288275 Transcript_100348/m.288275 type:complete len:331 (+) Transcript_100348:1253-2245(+)